jgi:dihydrofolate reductase
MVQTANGKITEGEESRIYKWTSKEDKAHFEGMVAKHNCIIMGSSTYEAAKKVIKPEPGKLRIVLTRRPEKYSEIEIPGQLEFKTVTPRELVDTLIEKGITEILLAGGGQINALFFNENLVDELYLTIEPVLFGEGKNIVDETVAEVPLQLITVEKLNEKGTILLHYKKA